MTTTLLHRNLLLVESDAEVAEQVTGGLKSSRSEHFSITHCTTLAAASDCIEDTSFELVICNLTLPDSEGLHTLDRLFSCQNNLTVLALSDDDDEDFALTVVRAGAQDYMLIREVANVSLLIRVVRYAIERHRYQENLKAARERQYYLANYDQITGLPNRLLFGDRLEQAIFLSRRRDEKFCVLFIDLDRFKFVNDSLGHNAGDLVLREVGIRLKKMARESDTVARFGGDEFAIILNDVNETQSICKYADKLNEALGKPVALNDYSATANTGGSIGIAVFPDHGDTGQEIMRAVDAAMYSAKANGGEGYVLFQPDMLKHN